MTPQILAERAKMTLKGTKAIVRVLDEKAIKKLKMGGLLGVGQGAHDKPRFIIVEYFGGKKSEAPVVFVGKGVTFDTGGISIKPAQQMEDMKFDAKESHELAAYLRMLKEKHEAEYQRIIETIRQLGDFDLIALPDVPAIGAGEIQWSGSMVLSLPRATCNRKPGRVTMPMWPSSVISRISTPSSGRSSPGVISSHGSSSPRISAAIAASSAAVCTGWLASVTSPTRPSPRRSALATSWSRSSLTRNPHDSPLGARHGVSRGR